MIENEFGEFFPPTLDKDGNSYNSQFTLRDYFAAKAMQGLMIPYWETTDKYESAEAMLKCQVDTAYEYADAMLERRKS
jgi:hypothetical protein